MEPDPSLAAAAPEIARAISSLVMPYQTAPQHMRNYLATSLRYAVRQFEMFVTPLRSVAAQAKADELGFGDLTQYRWGQRHGLKENGLHVFHWEHAQTVGHMSRLLTSLVEPTLPQIEAVVRSAVIVWVLVSEDAELRRLGYNTVRPDWRAAYACAGIQLIAPAATD